MKTRLSKVFTGILAAMYLASMALSGVAFATPQQVSTLQVPSEQQGPKRGVNPETGRVSFIGGGAPIHVPDLAPAKGLALESRAAGMVDIYGMEFGLRNPSQELKLLRSEKDANGNDIVRYQQVYNGVPILAGEMIVNMNANGELLSISGEVASDLALDINPVLLAEDAKKAALAEIASIHQIDPAQLTASSPELWIFDESLLKASTHPAELVWRVEVRANEVAQPIRELVLVNAQTGTLSFHVNQVDNNSASPRARAGISSTANPATLSCLIENGKDFPSRFLPYKQFLCNMTAVSVAVGDFNHDGRMDVAVAATATNSDYDVLVFLQDNTGALSQPNIYPAGIESAHLAAGDLNHDGLDDIVTADVQDNTISVFLQKSDGTLANRVTYPTGTHPDAIAVDDVNNDGWKDVVISHGSSAFIGVFTQKQGGTLNPMVTYTDPNMMGAYDDIAIGDVNGDGLNDVVKMSGWSGSHALVVYIQNNSHTLNSYTSYACPSCIGHGMGIGDVTGDGRSDVVMSYGGSQAGTSYIAVYAQNANGALQAPASHPAYYSPGAVQIADIDADNRLDIIALHNGWGRAGVFLQGSNGSLGIESLYPITGTYDLSVADVNSDGLVDLLMADGSGLTVLYQNDTVHPTATFTPSPSPTPGPGPSRTPAPTSTAGPSPTAVPASATGSRRTYTVSNGTTLPGTLLCDQTKTVCTNGADPDADRAHQYAADTFVFYNTHHKRNSFDNHGATIVSSVHYGMEYQNAGWDGTQMIYGDGMAADDVVGHELTHAVTQYSSNLIYSYQSGAINESFSDLWGEFIDQTNGAGNDSPAVKWLLGEDTTLGGLRSMSDPTIYGNPDKMSSPYYSYGPYDNGGVHINSGVNNKAAYLMTDGGTFNGRTITGIGLNKVAAVYYEVQANLLTAGANYNDLYYALIQGCQNLIGGAAGITQNNCHQVRAAAEAVEMVPLVTSTPTASTPTVTPPYSYNPLYLSLTSGQTLGGVSAADEDILIFDGTNWSLLFDGTDVGLGSVDLVDFYILNPNLILMSFDANVTVNGITANPRDILRFDATSLGSNTAGTFSLYFQGSDVGLTTSAENIDAFSSLNGQLYISTTGNPSVPGVSSAQDEDVLRFYPISLGSTTTGTWSLFFDGTDVGLGETSGEDVDALSVIGLKVYLSTAGAFSVTGLSGADEDVFVCVPTSTGDVTACNYSPNLYFDGSTWGLSANDVDAFNFLDASAVPTLVPSNTPTTVPGATNTPTRTATPSPTATSGTGSTPTRTPTVTATSAGGNTFTFTPVADAYVNAGSTATNYGTATTLRADASPDIRSYLRFNVQGVSGTVTQATLRVFANSASTQGCIASRVSDNTWSESTLNYNNAPPVGNALGSSGAFGTGVWINIDVTAYITGNGTYNLALTTPSSTAISFASRETGNGSQLVIKTTP